MSPDNTLRDLHELKKKSEFSGIPITGGEREREERGREWRRGEGREKKRRNGWRELGMRHFCYREEKEGVREGEKIF